VNIVSGPFHAMLTVALAIVGYLAARKQPNHTRGTLVVGATIGGGLGGAIVAAIVAAGGSFASALPFAALSLVTGALVGLLGVLAFALGAWLKRKP
jgi:protein-S-isoprenylcysteine O-methyltransferase Ste14